ncbi:MAG: LON peptidase substrate-binding domain-containing protein [Pseudobdellovibrio sp.]
MKCLLFPLVHANLFPLTTKPLNIFEPQYLQMVRDSIETQTPIVLAYVAEGDSKYRDIAGYGIPQIIEQRENNTILIFLPCVGKVKILTEEHDITKLYKRVEVEVINEDLNLDEKCKPMYVTLSKVLVQWIAKHIPDAQQRDVFINSLKGPQEVVNAFSAYLVRDYDMQYELMEILNINDQIEYLYRLLQSREVTS